MLSNVLSESLGPLAGLRGCTLSEGAPGPPLVSLHWHTDTHGGHCSPAGQPWGHKTTLWGREQYHSTPAQAQKGQPRVGILTITPGLCWAQAHTTLVQPVIDKWQQQLAAPVVCFCRDLQGRKVETGSQTAIGSTTDASSHCDHTVRKGTSTTETYKISHDFSDSNHVQQSTSLTGARVRGWGVVATTGALHHSCLWDRKAKW